VAYVFIAIAKILRYSFAVIAASQCGIFLV
jgi:hypothetical protein